MRAKREALGHAPAVLTIYLVITLLFLETTTLAPHRIWSVIAAVGYAITLILSSSRLLRGWIGTLTLLGTAIVPLAILSAAHVWQPEVQVLVDGVDVREWNLASIRAGDWDALPGTPRVALRIPSVHASNVCLWSAASTWSRGASRRSSCIDDKRLFWTTIQRRYLDRFGRRQHRATTHCTA